MLAVTVTVAAAVLAALALGVYLSWRATRLHRLHVRVDIARAALEEALRRRGAAVLDLVAARVRAADDPRGGDHGQVPAPVEELMAAATAALAAGGDGRRHGGPSDEAAGRQARRELAESRLSRALRAAVEPGNGPVGAVAGASSEEVRERLAAVAAAGRSVQLARTFYNDAVSDTRRARRSRPVRLFRLAGTAPLPDYFDIDDRAPRTPSSMVEPDTL
ncbi:hypothetical protein HNR10_001262 [Nocardiopsis aegyptia]|uniref:NUDIX hydrolase n=1 Tax=Nocardiopsis aegyptia TaxID=220378 RepID=A0A7Z0EKM7_9ACTN|nr:hypothetical protein [Nocardiopsis aegyptia]NYJ33381.1 hypothetical protein [Nocardiopsis aegyptia]